MKKSEGKKLRFPNKRSMVLYFLSGSGKYFAASLISACLVTLLDMVNPKIIARSGEYETEEGCLSLVGVRKAKRWQRITVTYQDQTFRLHTGNFDGFTAQIIQHEIDHCDGVLI